MPWKYPNNLYSLSKIKIYTLIWNNNIIYFNVQRMLSRMLFTQWQHFKVKLVWRHNFRFKVTSTINSRVTDPDLYFLVYVKSILQNLYPALETIAENNTIKVSQWLDSIIFYIICLLGNTHSLWFWISCFWCDARFWCLIPWASKVSTRIQHEFWSQQNHIPGAGDLPSCLIARTFGSQNKKHHV